MSDARLRPVPSPGEVAEIAAAPRPLVLDGRKPHHLDAAGPVLLLTAGYADLFAVRIAADGRSESAREHLFRVEPGEIIAPMPDRADGDGRLAIIAVGGPDTQAEASSRAAFDRPDLIQGWLIRLARVIAGPNPAWDIREAEGGEAEIAPGERRRGPARALAWVSVEAGRARLMGTGPDIAPGDPPVPLAAGVWIEAGPAGGRLAPAPAPEAAAAWAALDRVHAVALDLLHAQVAQRPAREAERLARRADLDTARRGELFDRLSGIVVRRPARAPAAADPGDPLLAACRLVAETIPAVIVRPPGRSAAREDFSEVIEIARSSRLRVRQTLLRGDWWRQDAGPLLAWQGEARAPVALLREARRYVLVEPGSGRRRVVDRQVAEELHPEAASFYPTLPSRPLGFRDLLAFVLRHAAHGNILRIVLPITLMGLLTMVSPLITQALVNSVIPRSELDQLLVCAIALGVTALAAAGVQTVEGLAMLRVEGVIDWKLQAAMIDRLLRLPASLFRDYTVGDLVDRSLGIDAVRRILTGRTLRSLVAGSFCWFSIALMLVYDATLALIAVVLAVLRGLIIMATSALRLYHEGRHFAVQGKVSGLVLQFLSGIGKLKVADATVRALAVWSRHFAEQRRHFIASQRTANLLEVVESAYTPLATIVIFAAASATGSTLTENLGVFLAFFAAFGQTMGAIGSWASGVSESLVAIPHLTRLKPLITQAAEIADDRKPPGELAGALELSRVTFRYAPGGPPVLDAVSLRIAAGEYVAIVGPSGSGKSSLFRLLLGFEQPESGAVFYDGKSLDTLDTSAVRRQLGVVLQNGRLATGSLYDNICGGVRLSLDQAWEAARLAALDGDIRAMPMGMHTLVAEGVNTLSGGQRQRLMIARAIARRPRILLLDEATSSLDNRSQAVVSASLGALNVTRLVIAHRLSTVREADRIVVLVDGKIVQEGTYEALSSAAGVFLDFTRRQLL